MALRYCCPEKNSFCRYLQICNQRVLLFEFRVATSRLDVEYGTLINVQDFKKLLLRKTKLVAGFAHGDVKVLLDVIHCNSYFIVVYITHRKAWITIEYSLKMHCNT